MYGSDFWTQSAEAMVLTLEGNRVIAHEIARGVRNLGRRAVGSLGMVLQGLGRHGRMPPL